MKKSEIIWMAFIEGGLVMLLEVSSPLIVSPVLGNSINIWAAMISISIGALALGYFAGGVLLNDKRRTVATVATFFSINSILLLLGWLLISLQNDYTFISDYRYSSWLIIFVILFLPLAIFGATTPVLISVLNGEDKQNQRVVGNVYAVSTLGGIVFSLFTGFYLVPEMGLMRTILMAAFITGAVSFIHYVRSGKIKYYASLGGMLLLCLIMLNKQPVLANTSSIKVLEYSESANGQLIVADMYKDEQVERILFINRMGQTWINLTSNYSVWGYPNYLTSLASIYPAGTNSLVLGLGGGIVSRQLKEYNKFNVEAVELDERIIAISKKYFKLDKSGVRIYHDDARRFIKNSKKKYDFIVLDIFSGELVPSHGLSKESFDDIKRILDPKGMLVINFNGFLTGKEGLAGRSLLKTLTESGFSLKLFSTNETNEEDRNMLYIAYLNEPEWEKASIHVNVEEGQFKIADHFTDVSKIDMSDAILITDDKPVMEYINRYAAARWRENYYKNFTLKFKDDYKVPLIN
jgi:predicted membrane-bound spermidine synthase